MNASQPNHFADEPFNPVQQLASMEAEQYVIGSALANPVAAQEIKTELDADDFFFEKNRNIINVIYRRIDSGQSCDVFAVCDELKTKFDDDLSDFAFSLSASASSANVPGYIAVVGEHAKRRNIYESGQYISSLALSDKNKSAGEIIDLSESRITELNKNRDDGLDGHDINLALKNYLTELDRRHKSKSELNGEKCGFGSIDYYTDGLKSGELVVVAGRPSMGKSTLALQMCGSMSVYSKLNGLYFSLEMPVNDLTQKLIAWAGNINLNDLKHPKSAREEFWSKLNSATTIIKDSSLRIVACSGLHIRQLKSYARKCHISRKLDYIAVDHVHLMRGEGQNDERRIADISQGLKSVAMELGIPVIALCQLNRGVEGRAAPQPRLSDLRGSGSLEQDADIVMLIHRDDYYDESKNPGLVQVEIAKNRNGEVGKVVLQNHYAQSRLEESNQVMDFSPVKKRYASHDL